MSYIPLGFDKGFKNNNVWQLKRPLYGLKQSPRAWFRRFSKTMVDKRFQQSQRDHTFLVKTLIIRESNIFYSSCGWYTSDEWWSSTKDDLRRQLSKEFEIKDLEGQVFFGYWSCSLKKWNFHLTAKKKKKKNLDLLKETRMLGCKSTNTLINRIINLEKPKKIPP